MTISVNHPLQFRINELVVVTKYGKIDISAIYEEINIFDSLFMPVMSGKILIKDSIGLSSKLIFDGSESILIDIVKDEKQSNFLNFKKAFRIYKQSDRSNDGMNSEFYVLHFVSDELIFSDQQRINQSYEMTYTDMIKKIVVDYLKLPANKLGGIYDETVGLRKIVVPNLRPLEAIEWISKRSVDGKVSPNFVFYENITGFNFASLSKLLSNPIILDLYFEPKNIKENTELDEMKSARSLEIVSQTDAVEKTRSGVTAGKFIGFDPLTRTIATKEISYGDHYDKMTHSNPTKNLSIIDNRAGMKNIEMFDSKKTVSTFGAARKYSEYIKRKDPTSITKEDNIEEYLFQRKAIIRNLMERRLKLTMPGNFSLSSGFNVDVTAPIMAKKEKGTSNEDETITAKYLIVGTRHIIGYEKHETIIEVASSSSEVGFIPVSSAEQQQEILGY